jgi:thiosulfate reductase cytochrome b subunit
VQLIQYPSLQGSTENGWVAHDSLQLLAYFIAPGLALITGLGMSTAISTRFKPISRKLSIQRAWSLHFLVLVSFLFFIVVHVSLVFTTGLMRDLNHIYAGRNDDGWVSFWIFVPRRVPAARATGGAV